MQPYLWPYIGYLQLMAAVDYFVLLDDVAFIRRGWINRNRVLLNGNITHFVLPVQKSPQATSIKQIQLAMPVQYHRDKLLELFRHAYSHCPGWQALQTLLVPFQHIEAGKNLSQLLQQTLLLLRDHLQLDCQIELSSAIEKPAVEGVERILHLAKTLGADTYLNLPGGSSLYRPEIFAQQGLKLGFIEPQFRPYRQHGTQQFVAGLSILDVLANNQEAQLPAEFLECSILNPHY